MNDREDLERLLRAHYAATADPRVPGGQLAAVVARTQRVRQQPAWRLALPGGGPSTEAARAASAIGQRGYRLAWALLMIGLLTAAITASLLAGGPRNLGVMVDPSRPANASNAPASPLLATFAPGSIAFARTDGVYVMASDGTDRARIATGPDIGQVSFSPDGRSLAYVESGAADASGQRSPNETLRVIAADGRSLGSYGFGDLASAWGIGWEFQWSPDGQRLAVNSAVDGRNVIKIIGLDGAQRGVVPLPKGFANSTFNGWAYDLFSWSPDGRWFGLVGCMAPCSTDRSGKALLLATDGSTSRWLESRKGLLVGAGKWTPDSLQIAVADVDGGTELLQADGSGSRAFSKPAGRMLAWSPDGDRLLTSDGGVLEVIGLDGQPRMIAARSPVDATMGSGGSQDAPLKVRWAADGRSVLVTVCDDVGCAKVSLWAFDINPGAAHRIADDVGELFDVAP